MPKMRSACWQNKAAFWLSSVLVPLPYPLVRQSAQFKSLGTCTRPRSWLWTYILREEVVGFFLWGNLSLIQLSGRLPLITAFLESHHMQIARDHCSWSHAHACLIAWCTVDVPPWCITTGIVGVGHLGDSRNIFRYTHSCASELKEMYSPCAVLRAVYR